MAHKWKLVNGVLTSIPVREWRPDPNGPTYPAQCFKDPAWCTEHGLMDERYANAKPDERVYNVTLTREVVNGEVVCTYVGTLRDVAPLKAQKLAEIAAWRYNLEVGGVTVGGMPVSTDRDSQNKYLAARTVAKEDNTYTVNWKTEAGFVQLTAMQIIAIADAVRTHVQAAYDAEAVHIVAVEALTDAQSIIDYVVS